MLSGRGYHRTWDRISEKEIDEYNFAINYTVGTGVHGDRLLKLNPTEHQEIYDQLLEKAIQNGYIK